MLHVRLREALDIATRGRHFMVQPASAVYFHYPLKLHDHTLTQHAGGQGAVHAHGSCSAPEAARSSVRNECTGLSFTQLLVS